MLARAAVAEKADHPGWIVRGCITMENGSRRGFALFEVLQDIDERAG
jgi:hypothetical protein